MTALRIPARFAAAAALLAFFACSSTPAPDGGKGSTGGSSGGGTGGTVFQIPDGGPPSAAQICQWLWAGATRFGLVFTLPGLTAPTSETGPYCPSPTPTQQAAFGQAAAAAAPEILTLAPPDGGWPDGGAAGLCGDPTSQLSMLAAAIAQSVASGSLAWNVPALAACQQGMSASADLVAYAADGGGSFPGQADVFGVGDAGGACLALLRGLVPDGGGCLFGFECQDGFYCRSAGADGSCGGNCAPLVPAGGGCGLLDQCAGSLSCTSGVCGGPDAGAPPPPGGPGNPCTTDAQCQSCLVCSGSPVPACHTGLTASTCTSDVDCDVPLLYCATGGTCQPSATIGQSCTAGSYFACLDGWCDPIAHLCRPSSNLGGPCAESGDCASGYCSGATAVADGTCTSLPGHGLPCGAPPSTYSCASPGDYCNLPQGQTSGTCQSLPGAGQPCASGACAEGLYCTGTLLCQPLPGDGQPCSVPGMLCQSPYVCRASGSCGPSLPGNAPCAQSQECASGECVGGLCTTPCSSQPYGSGLLLSLLLGLGGALAWLERR